MENTPETNGAQQHTRSKRKRLASDVIGQLEDSLKEDDTNIATWLDLIDKTVQKDKIENVRDIYDRFLKKFPFLSRQWIAYVEYEQSRGEFECVNNIIKKCLVSSSGVELWKTYVNFVRRQNNLITGGEEARRVIFQAYDLATDKAGADPEAGSLWTEYINFIDDWNPGSTWDEQQKMDLKRKVYKKALQIPLSNLENLWGDYNTFEMELNPNTSRKFIGDLSPAYMRARELYTQLLNATQGIDRSLETIPSKNDVVQSQLQKWKDWVNWEKMNKLELEQDAHMARVEYVYTQGIQKLVFSPELWYDYVEFYRINPTHYSSTRVQNLLVESLLPNPTSFALNLKLIELHEMEGNDTLVSKRFETFIKHLSAPYERLSSDIEEQREIIIEREMAKKQEGAAEDEEEIKPFTDDEKTFYFEKSSKLNNMDAELQKMKKTLTLTYCLFMKAMKRMKGLPEARSVFKAARATKRCTHHIFAENAYLEYQAADKKATDIALKVFELGLRPSNFGHDGEYIYKYLKFLMNINDDINSRTVFETTITTKKDSVDVKWLKKMFKIFMNYEMQIGQLSSVEKLEKKYYEMFPDDSKLLVFADRYSFNMNPDDYNVEDDLVRFVDLKETESVKQVRGTKRKLDVSETASDTKRAHESHVDAPVDREEAQDDGMDGNKADTSDSEEGGQFVSDEIYNLLRILPNASYFEAPLFNNAKLIKHLREMK